MKHRYEESRPTLEPLPPMDKSLLAALERARALKEKRSKKRR